MRALRAGAGIGLGALLAVPPLAQADDFRVTNLSDDASMEGPAGSLHRALSDANGTAGPDRVLFKSKLSGTIHLTGPIDIYGSDVEIVGPGARKVTVTGDGPGPLLVPYTGVFSPTPFDVAISGLTFSGNEVAGPNDGGAIEVLPLDGAIDLTLSRVTISGNTAGDDAGGLSMASGDGGSLVIENSTISGNSAGEDGGGIYSTGFDVSIRSSTISGNSATDEGGGANIEGGTFELRNSTVTGNEAAIGGGFYEGGVDPELHASIVAGNSAPSDTDLEGEPWATSFSLIGETDLIGIDDEGGNIFNADPKLKPLKDNGGPTNTHAFKKSPAKNKGPGDAPNSDQRGAPRKGKADIGAYELAKCEGVIVNRVGTAGKDKLKGTKKKDGILGLGGNDKLSGKKGKDGLCGGSGKDKLKGGPGKDKLDGGPGKDKEVQ